MGKEVGVCGILCKECIMFKSGKCPGCRPNEFCPLPSCVAKHNVNFCFDCPEFPCKTFEERGPFVKELVEHWKTASKLLPP